MRVGTFLKDRKLIFVESKIYKRLVGPTFCTVRPVERGKDVVDLNLDRAEVSQGWEIMETTAVGFQMFQKKWSRKICSSISSSEFKPAANRT